MSTPHVPEGKASDRVAEKATALDERLALIERQNASERAAFPPAPAPKAKASK